jgi:hypothetical protein
MDDYYQLMVLSQLERQEMEEQEHEWSHIEREECLAKLDRDWSGSKKWKRKNGKENMRGRKKEKNELRSKQLNVT